MRARSAASTRPSTARTISICSSSRPPCSAALATRADVVALLAQLRRAARAGRRALAPRLELGERRLEGDAQPERGLAPALGVDVGARAQRELLAGQRDVAAGEQRGEALLRAQRGGSPGAARRAAPGARQLAGAVPAAVGDALAVAEADAHDERLLARDLARVGVGRRDAVGVQHAVQARERVVGQRVEVGVAPASAAAAS